MLQEVMTIVSGVTELVGLLEKSFHPEDVQAAINELMSLKDKIDAAIAQHKAKAPAAPVA